MATIRYWFVDGTSIEVEVENSFAIKYSELAHRQHLVDRKETRRHQSLNRAMEHGFEAAANVNVEQEVELRADLCRLNKVLSELANEQQELIHKVFFADRKLCDIANSLGISASCLWHRLHRLLVKLKEHIN